MKFRKFEGGSCCGFMVYGVCMVYGVSNQSNPPGYGHDYNDENDENDEDGDDDDEF